MSWLSEKEAAKHCHLSLEAFRRFAGGLAKNAGGRKVYHPTDLDSLIRSQPWQPSISAAPAITSIFGKEAAKSACHSALLSGERRRLYVPRKRRNSQE